MGMTWAEVIKKSQASRLTRTGRKLVSLGLLEKHEDYAKSPLAVRKRLKYLKWKKLMNGDGAIKLYERSQQKKAWVLRKIKVLNRLGGKCMCCAESIPEFMNIDHINNNGNIERRNGMSGRDIYNKVLRMENPELEYQLLCANCNLGKRLRGTCPHQAVGVTNNRRV